MEEEKATKIFRASAAYYELIILYTTLTFFVLAQSLLNSYPETREYLLLSSIFSTFSLLFAMLSNFIMMLTKITNNKNPEEIIHRISLGCFFFSVFLLLLSLFNLYNSKCLKSISTIIIEPKISSILWIFLFIIAFVIFYTILIKLIRKNERICQDDCQGEHQFEILDKKGNTAVIFCKRCGKTMKINL